MRSERRCASRSGGLCGTYRSSFVKSANDKSIRPMIYTDGSRLPGPDAVDPDVRDLVSDIVQFRTEVRLHLLDGQVHASKQYGVDGALSLGPAAADALLVADDLLSDVADTLPSAIVVDIGLTDDGWAVIEANAAWASGYTGDPQRLLDVVLRAARPIGEQSDRDRPFLRG